MRVAAIVQARMRSTRLPGKVLREISGRPVIGHVIDRLRACPSVSEVAIVTSTEPEDDALAAFANEEAVQVFRGPEEDVLGRFQLAVEALDPDRILRVTGDCPLLSPFLIETFLAQMDAQGADFLLAEDNVPCIQEGVDPISRRAFDTLVTEARDDPFAREHVTSYFKLHPDKVAIGRLKIPEEYQFSGARISIDTPADLRFVDTLESQLGPVGDIDLEDVVSLLRREPWLMTLNANVRQKGAGDVNGSVLIRADGGASLGYGHIMRCLSLAHQLRDAEGLGVVFLTGLHPYGDLTAAVAAIKAQDFPVLTAEDLAGADHAVPEQTEEDLISAALERVRASHLVVDVRTDLTRESLRAIHKQGIGLTVLDDASARRTAGDLAVYPLVPAIDALGWGEYQGRVLTGGAWTLLSRSVTETIERDDAEGQTSSAPRLLVTLGGSDPMNWTKPVVHGLLAHNWPLGTRIDVILGPGVADVDATSQELAGLAGVVVHHNPPAPAKLMASATLAIAAFGVTAYELAALGVPTIYLFLSEDHRRSASGLIGAGAGFAGNNPGVSLPGRVAKAATMLLQDEQARIAMSNAGKRAIDGQAAKRLAVEIKALMRKRQDGFVLPQKEPQIHQPSRQFGQAG